MASQSGKALAVSYKVEATYNTAPGTGSALQLRLNASPGLSLKKAPIISNEIRADGLSSMPRHGSRMVDGSYNMPVTVGGLDTVMEAITRSTWVAPVVITFDNGAALTSLTVNSSSQITFAGTTTPIAAGLRAGDVFRLANMSTAGNNAVNARVKSIVGSVVNLHGTPLTIQAADTACTLTIMKKVKNGTTPTKRTFYFEQYNQDIDVSEVFGGVKFISLKLTGSPDGNATAEVSLLGASGTTLASGASPYYVSPTLPTGIELVFVDASIAYNGSDVTACTAFELTYTIAAKTEPVIGSTVSPDVFDNDARLTGTLSFIRQDLANVALFVAETEVALHLLLVEPESEPKDCVAVFVPRIKLMGVEAALGADGAMIETLQWTAGKSESVTGVDDTLMTISTSAA